MTLPETDERDSKCPFCHLALMECVCEDVEEDEDGLEAEMCWDCERNPCECIFDDEDADEEED